MGATFLRREEQVAAGRGRNLVTRAAPLACPCSRHPSQNLCLEKYVAVSNSTSTLETSIFAANIWPRVKASGMTAGGKCIFFKQLPNQMLADFLLTTTAEEAINKWKHVFWYLERCAHNKVRLGMQTISHNLGTLVTLGHHSFKRDASDCDK